MAVYTRRAVAWSSPSPQASEVTNPAGTLTLGSQPPELRDNTFLLFKPPRLCSFVTSGLENKYKPGYFPASGIPGFCVLSPQSREGGPIGPKGRED